jgi:hypothetical protein
MGNRGILHSADRKIVKRWAHKNWIACDPSFRGIIRTPLFQPGRYSELFFLDEATAFAAGHRPCNYCQHQRFIAFRRAWQQAHPNELMRADEIDARIHTDRVRRDGNKVTYPEELANLPDGAIIERDAKAFLIYAGRLWQWSFVGYSPAGPVDTSNVAVLTPHCIVEAFRSGFVPSVHGSVQNAVS